MAQAFAPFLFAVLFSLSKRQFPIRLFTKRAISRHDDVVPGENFSHAAVNGFWRGNISERKVIVEGLWVHVAREVIARQKTLQLRSEEDALGISRIKQRFLAKTIPRHQEFPLIGIPYDDRKHPAQPSEAIPAILFVEMHDGFCIRACG